MNKTTVIVNAATAFVITTGLALGVVFVGGKPTGWQVAAALCAGAVSAAKDTRSLLKMPPVGDDTKPQN